MLNILIIDDEEQNLELMKAFLESHLQCAIFEASSGNEAMELLKSGQDFDFIISDLRMPNGSGYDVLEFFTSSSLKAYFILHTTYPIDDLPSHDQRFLGVVSKHNYTKLTQLIHE